MIRQSSDGALVGRRFQLVSTTSPVTIGRDPACSLEIRSNAVSRRHARLEWRTDAWYVVDERSTSGTYVNTERVTERRLIHGDVLQIGDTVLSFAEYIIETHLQPGPTDGLTKLPTKRFVMEHIESMIRSGVRPLTLIRVDVDKLRLINNDRGYPEGDRILAAVAAQLRAGLRTSEYAGRLSADDFVIVLPGVDLATATTRADEIREQLLSIAPVSVGSAQHALSHRDADELIYTAEKDMVARRARR